MVTSNVEWLSQNATRRYPLMDGASLTNGAQTIPNDFIVAAVFSGATVGRSYYISKIEVLSATVLQVTLRDSQGDLMGVFNVAGPLSQDYETQFFQPNLAEYKSLRGKVIFAEGVEEVLSWGVGEYAFDVSATEILPSLLVPAAIDQGVTSLGVQGSSEAPLVGDVRLQAGTGVALTTYPNTNVIQIDMSRKYALDCASQLEKYAPCEACIKFINGIAPREDGVFEIIGSQWINVENFPGEGRIEISLAVEFDPCCNTCDELEDLKADIEQVRQDVQFISGA